MVVIYYSDARIVSHQVFPAYSKYSDNPYPTLCAALGWGHASDSVWIIPGTMND